MDEGGVEILDDFGVPIPNYIQKNIYSFARIWTGFLNSKRRANNEEQGKKCYKEIHSMLSAAIL